MTIPLKATANGELELFASGDTLNVDVIEPRSAGHIIIGATLGAGDEVRLGVVSRTTRVMGEFAVDGSSTITTNETVTGTFNANGDVNLGNNSGDAVGLGGGTTDVVTLKSHLVMGAGLVRIGASVTDYALDLWLDAVNASGPALAAYNLNATGTNAGAYAIGVDDALLGNSTATDLMTVLDDLDAAITGGAASLQASYAVGNTIAVTAANGIFDVSNDTNTDTTTALRIGRAPSGSTAGLGVDIQMGANTTGVGLTVNQAGSGNGIEIKDGGTNILHTTGAGAIVAAPTSGQNFSATVAGAGTAGLNSASGIINLTSSAAAVNISAAATSSIATSAGNIDIDAVAGELGLDDVGSWGGTLSQTSFRTLVQTASTEVLEGATSLLGAINKLASRIDANGGGPIESLPIENTEVIAAEDVVVQSTVSGRVRRWDGSSAAQIRFLGIALTGGTGDAGGTVFSRVAFPGNTITGTGTAFTPGAALFGPDGTGKVTETAPAGDGDAIKRLGWARTTVVYVLEPGPTIITHT